MRPSTSIAIPVLVLAWSASVPSAAAQCFAWNDAFATPLPGTIGDVVSAAVHDDGSGPALWVGGQITRAGTTPVRGIARWDGSAWSAAGDGIEGSPLALAAFDDGTGTAHAHAEVHAVGERRSGPAAVRRHTLRPWRSRSSARRGSSGASSRPRPLVTGIASS